MALFHPENIPVTSFDTIEAPIVMPIPKTPIEEGFERIFGKMNNIDTPEDTELLKTQLHRLIIENQSEDGAIDISDQSMMAEEIMNLITLYTNKIQETNNIDLNAYENQLEAQVSDIEAFNLFIKKWCGSHVAHLLDSDDNDGNYMRNRIAQLTNPKERTK